MVMTMALLAIGLGLLAGCAPSLRKIGEINVKNIKRVQVGDLRADVIKRMGSTTVIAQHGQEVPSPYRRMEFENTEGHPTEILYYYTGTTHVGSERNHTVIREELTPIVLEWGVVVGIGWSFLQANQPVYGSDFIPELES
jgi:hypothetical protein